jgi:hypothetical protein
MEPVNQQHIKQEEDDSTQGLFSGVETYIPPNFEADEWNNLIDVIITACYHIQG